MADGQETPQERRDRFKARQKRFVAEYLIDLNATKAAIRAGYAPKSAGQQGERLLKLPQISAAVERAQAVRSRRTAITQDRVLQELSVLAFSNVANYKIDDEGHVTLAPKAPKRALRAVSSIKRKVTTRMAEDGPVTTYETEIKLWDKPGPLRWAGKHVGLDDNEKAAPPTVINLHTGMAPPPELASAAQDSTLKKEGE